MIAVITGASKGIGYAIAETFAKEGYNLFLTSRNKDEIELTGKTLSEKYTIKVTAIASDLSKKQGVQYFSDVIKSQTQTIDVLVNNAGRYLPGEIHKEEEGILEEMIETNLYSVYNLTRALMPEILNTKNAHIFNMCSIASKIAYPNGGSYSISKFALLGFNKVLREELKDKGIKVTAILPGATWSDSWKGATLPYERLMEAEDIAKTIIACTKLSASACVEEIILRPQLGDL